MTGRKRTTSRFTAAFAVVAVFIVPAVLLAACGRKYAPKPYGYPRIERDSVVYMPYDSDMFPLAFDLPSDAVVDVNRGEASSVWINISYPEYGATLYCTYLPLRKRDAGAERAKAADLVYLHASKATSIDASSFEGGEVSATVYRLYGNVATPVQFVADDGDGFLMRGALYFNMAVEPDSVAPVVDFVENDVRRLLETLKHNR